MTDYQAMPAGQEMDLLVAERIFGFHWEEGSGDVRKTLWGPKPDQNWGSKHGGLVCPFDEGAYAEVWKNGLVSIWLCDRPRLPQFSAVMLWAWLIVEKYDLLVGRECGEWLAGISSYTFTGIGDEDGYGETAPLAICRAALSIEEEREKKGLGRLP